MDSIKPVGTKEEVESTLIEGDKDEEGLLNPIEETIDIPVQPEVKEVNQSTEAPKGTKEIGNNYVTDDQFFDDFFSDDE